jgi:hypothetical protein
MACFFHPSKTAAQEFINRPMTEFCGLALPKGSRFSAISKSLCFSITRFLLAQAGEFTREMLQSSPGVIQISGGIPAAFSLSQKYPNPFNPETRIIYSIPKSSNVSFTVYDAAGRKVAVLVNQNQAAGTYRISFDGSALS